MFRRADADGAAGGIDAIADGAGRRAMTGWRRWSAGGAEDVRGYFLDYAFGGSELLFEADLPGNNYPAPIVAGDIVYVIRAG